MIDNKELHSRREFFKKAGKVVLPFIAGMVLSFTPQIMKASTNPMGCELGCYGGCKSGCEGKCKYSCSGGCNDNCAVSCDKTCKRICSDDCYKACTGGNQAYLE